MITVNTNTFNLFNHKQTVFFLVLVQMYFSFTKDSSVNKTYSNSGRLEVRKQNPSNSSIFHRSQISAAGLGLLILNN